MSISNTIIVEDIYKSYKKIKAVDGISLTAETGKVLGLLGPNGAGKTTLVRMLTTLLKPDSGRAYIAGVNVLKNPARVREIIGLAGQYPAVDEQLTGRENLQMVGQLYHFSRSEAKQRGNELLARFNLEDAADRPVKTYSGGMRRRLDLAASIVARPPVLLLDEPTTGLDPRTRKDLWGLIRELVQDGTTLLLTTQYLEEADVLADRIVLIDGGKVIAQGTSDELKSQLAGDIVEVTLADAKFLPQALATLAEIGLPQGNAETGTIKIAVDNGTQRLIETVRTLDGLNIAIADLTLRRPSLDDVFLTLTGKGKTDSAA